MTEFHVFGGINNEDATATPPTVGLIDVLFLNLLHVACMRRTPCTTSRKYRCI
jgi:hypothetical protein